MAKKVRKAGKIPKKTWYQIVGPEIFNKQVLGETLVEESERLVGKTITVNLMALTGDPKKHATAVTFEVTKVADSKGLASVTGWKMTPSAVKRLIRRNKDRIDESMVCYTADGLKVRVKPMVVTRSRAKSKVTQQLRIALKEYMIKSLKQTAFDNFIASLVTFRFQKSIKERLNPIYPIAMAEVRVVKILGGERKEIVEKPEPKLEEKSEEKPPEEPKLEEKPEPAQAEPIPAQ